MSDPTERYKIEAHPISSHRTPAEIAEDEAGPIGNWKARNARPAEDEDEVPQDERGEDKQGSTRPS